MSEIDDINIYADGSGDIVETENPMRVSMSTADSTVKGRTATTVISASGHVANKEYDDMMESSEPLLKEGMEMEVLAYENPHGPVRKEFIVHKIAVQDAQEEALRVEQEFLANEKEKAESAHTPGTDDPPILDEELIKLRAKAQAAKVRLKSPEITMGHNDLQIERIIRIDDEVLHAAQDTSMLLMENKLRKMIEQLGFEVVSCVPTVAFFNAPRKDEDHVGEGFFVITKKPPPPKTYDVESDGNKTSKTIQHFMEEPMSVHFYEYDVVSDMSSTLSSSATQENISMVKTNLNLSSSKVTSESKSMKQGTSDINMRKTRGIYSSINVRDIISAYHFYDGKVKREETTKGSFFSHTSVSEQRKGFCEDCMFAMFKCMACECFSIRCPECCKIECICDCCKQCCPVIECNCCKQTEETNISNKAATKNVGLYSRLGNLSLKGKLDMLCSKIESNKRASTFLARNPIDNEEYDLKGIYTEDSFRKSYVGVEIYYLDHVSRSKEKGAILFHPEAELSEILRATSCINMKISTYDQTILRSYGDYSISNTNPLRYLDIDAGSAQEALDPVSNAIANALVGIDPIYFEKIDCPPSKSYTFASAGVGVSSFAGIITSAIAATMIKGNKNEDDGAADTYIISCIQSVLQFLSRVYDAKNHKKNLSEWGRRRDVSTSIVNFILFCASASSASNDENGHRRLRGVHEVESEEGHSIATALTSLLSWVYTSFLGALTEVYPVSRSLANSLYHNDFFNGGGSNGGDNSNDDPNNGGGSNGGYNSNDDPYNGGGSNGGYYTYTTEEEDVEKTDKGGALAFMFIQFFVSAVGVYIMTKQHVNNKRGLLNQLRDELEGDGDGDGADEATEEE